MNSKEYNELIIYSFEEFENIYKVCNKLMGSEWLEKTQVDGGLELDRIYENWILRLEGGGNPDLEFERLSKNELIEFLCCTMLRLASNATFQAVDKLMLLSIKSIAMAKETASLVTMKSSLDKSTSEFYKRAAIKRHAENYSMKRQAIQYWRDNIDAKLSNDKAASILLKVVPLSHRKLSEYVSEAKKQNTHSAG